jgi:hypothetical protein
MADKELTFPAQYVGTEFRSGNDLAHVDFSTAENEKLRVSIPARDLRRLHADLSRKLQTRKALDARASKIQRHSHSFRSFLSPSVPPVRVGGYLSGGRSSAGRVRSRNFALQAKCYLIDVPLGAA